MGIHSLFKASSSNKMKLSLLLAICFLGFVSSAWINIDDELSSPSLERRRFRRGADSDESKEEDSEEDAMRTVMKIVKKIVMMKILSAMKMPPHVKHKQNMRTEDIWEPKLDTEEL